MKLPLDHEDRSIIVTVLLVLLLCLVAAAVLGLCVRIFLFLAVGGH